LEKLEAPICAAVARDAKADESVDAALKNARYDGTYQVKDENGTVTRVIHVAPFKDNARGQQAAEAAAISVVLLEKKRKQDEADAKAKAQDDAKLAILADPKNVSSDKEKDAERKRIVRKRKAAEAVPLTEEQELIARIADLKARHFALNEKETEREVGALQAQLNFEKIDEKEAKRVLKRQNKLKVDTGGVVHKLMRETKAYGNKKGVFTTVPPTAFKRVVRDLVDEQSKGDLCISKQAFHALHEAAEAFLVRRCEDANLCTLHAGRKTLFVSDMRLVQTLVGGPAYNPEKKTQQKQQIADAVVAAAALEEPAPKRARKSAAPKRNKDVAQSVPANEQFLANAAAVRGAAAPACLQSSACTCARCRPVVVSH